VTGEGTLETPLSAARRKAIVALLPPDLRDSATALVDALNAATIAELQVFQNTHTHTHTHARARAQTHVDKKRC
jgi:uncharacterized membrane protein